MEARTTGDYRVPFLLRHSSDNHLCDDNAKRWSFWYEYVMDKKNIHIYEARMVFRLPRKPNEKMYILWTYFIRLTGSSCSIRRPFNF